MARWNVDLDWFGDDSEDVEVEADTIEAAAARVHAEWSPTGWTSATVSGQGRRLWIDLETRELNSTEV